MNYSFIAFIGRLVNIHALTFNGNLLQLDLVRVMAPMNKVKSASESELFL